MPRKKRRAGRRGPAAEPEEHQGLEFWEIDAYYAGQVEPVAPDSDHFQRRQIASAQGLVCALGFRELDP